MRKVDYMGSRPVASKLLFAPPPPGSEDEVGSFELDAAQAVGLTPDTCDPGPSA